MSKKILSKRKWTRNDVDLLLMAIAGALFLFVFAYIPMFGVVLAFKDGDKQLNVLNTIINGKWVGFRNFAYFFNDYNFPSIMTNTICLNLLMLAINFPAPIIFALFINEIRSSTYKKAVQSISTFPTFLSWIVFGGILLSLMDMNTGVLNPLLELIGLSSKDNPVNLGRAQYFWVTIILSSLIKGVGWSSIIYTAAIAGIDTELYEAADMDGAGRIRKMVSITLPSIAPTITVFFLLSVSGLLNNSFEHLYVFQNAVNTSRSEVITTYSYKLGITQRRYSFTTAIGLFQSGVSFLLLVLSNFVSKRITGRGIF